MKQPWLLFAALLLASPASMAQRPPGPGVPPHAPARAQPRIEVLVLDASMGSGGIAPELAGMRHLHEPPFTGYTQISVVSRATLPLSSQPALHPLPDGGSLAVTLLWHGRKDHYSVECTMTRAGRTNRIQFVAAPDAPFFSVRPAQPGHTRIIRFVVHPARGS